MRQRFKKALVWVGPGLVILAADRVFKLLFHDAQQVVIPGVLALHGAKNTGMAMGMFAGNALPLLILSILLMAICVYTLKKWRVSGLGAAAVSMMAGGAIGNAFDRAVFGYVVDMVEVLFIDFYIFNIADVGVVCGAILCGISLFFRPQDWNAK